MNDVRVTYNVPDGGRGWLVVFASFANHVLFDGVNYSSGVFYTVFLDYFQTSRNVTSWVASINSGCWLLSAPIIGLMIRRWGCRLTCMIGASLAALGMASSTFVSNIYVLYVTFGALSGLGFSMMFFPSVICVGWYFDKRRSFATGLAASGAGVGMIVMPPVTQFLLAMYGWRGALLIVGGIIANGIACGATFAPLPQQKVLSSHEKINVADKCSEEDVTLEERSLTTELHSKSNASNIVVTFSSNLSLVFRHEDVKGREDDRNHLSKEAIQSNYSRYKRLLRDPIFHIYLLHGLYGLGYSVPFVFLPDYAKSIGIDPQDASLLISTIGIVSTIFRLLLGALADLKQAAPFRLYIYVGCIVIGGLSMAVIGYCKSYGALVVCAVLYGVSMARFAVTTQLMLDLFSMDVLVEVFVISFFVSGIVSLLGTPFTGWLYDTTGSYVMPFVVAGAITAGSSCFLLVVPLVKKYRQKREMSPH